VLKGENKDEACPGKEPASSAQLGKTKRFPTETMPRYLARFVKLKTERPDALLPTLRG